jgi:hypothetical protein
VGLLLCAQPSIERTLALAYRYGALYQICFDRVQLVGGRRIRPAEPFSGAALAGFAGQRRTRNMHSSVRDLILEV